MGTHPSKVQGKANDNMNRHNPKKSQKQTTNKKIRKRQPYANRTQGYEMTINDNKENLRRKSSCLPQIV
jgi:hypothetical protein